MNDEQAIRGVIDEWHRATAAGDIDKVAPLMTDDVAFLVAGKPPMIGRDKFIAGLRELLKTHRIASSGEVQELAVAGDLGYCVTHLTVRMHKIDGSDPLVRTGFTLSIFKRDAAGAWRLSRDANLLPAPESAS